MQISFNRYTMKRPKLFYIHIGRRYLHIAVLWWGISFYPAD